LHNESHRPWPLFLTFASAYFFSTLVRSVTATLAPALSAEFGLHARDLGLLAGGYFLGFAATQLPMGRWLDAHGPKRVLLAFLSMAVLGCAAFSLASGFAGLWAARFLTGMGLSACLMAPLTGYRRWMPAPFQLRANAWMLMTGSLGMVASTLPVQWLLPQTGWRPLFWGLAALFVVAMALIALRVPGWSTPPVAGTGRDAPTQGYGPVWRSRYFWRLAPMGFVAYGGMVAWQTLWVGPWLVQAGGQTPGDAAAGLFGVNVAMLVTFWLWGLWTPRLAARGWGVDRLVAWLWPLAAGVAVLTMVLGPAAGWPVWALFCVCSSVLSLCQPAVAMALPPDMAGRALSAYNLVIFGGVFAMQWGLGLVIDAGVWLGWSLPDAYRGAMGFYLCAAVGAYVFFRAFKADNPAL